MRKGGLVGLFEGLGFCHPRARIVLLGLLWLVHFVSNFSMNIVIVALIYYMENLLMVMAIFFLFEYSLHGINITWCFVLVHKC